MSEEVVCLFVREHDHTITEVCLGMMKEDFGKGKWNGAGGKLNPGESPETAARRECLEEFNSDPTDLTRAGTLTFHWPDKPGSDHLVHVFLVRTWVGDPQETPAMRPQWFGIADIPYDAMWAADAYWLPSVLAGKKVQASFTYRSDRTLAEHHIEEVTGL